MTGLSGAGKTVAIRTLEDLGYRCIDNLPLPLLESATAYFQTQSKSRFALGLDIRDHSFSDNFLNWIGTQEENLEKKIIFLKADREILLRRYSATKRGHPLSSTAGSLESALQMEERLLEPISKLADFSLDTSTLNPHELKSILEKNYSGEFKGRPLLVRIESFGFKNGGSSKSDFVADLRIVKNPFFEPQLSKKSGLSREVADYIFADPVAVELLARLEDYLRWSLPLAYKEGKTHYHLGWVVREVSTDLLLSPKS